MKVKKFSVAGFSSNCYLVLDDEEKRAVAVDPSVPYQSVMQELNAPVTIDAIVAIDDWKIQTNAPLMIGKNDVDSFVDPKISYASYFNINIACNRCDRALGDKDRIPVGGQSLTVMNTPGHSPGSICLLGEDFVISGDTLFADGSVGRSDFHGGNTVHLWESVKALLRLPTETAVYPGHGYATTIGREAQYHSFLGDAKN